MRKPIIKYLEEFEKFYKEERDKALIDGDYENAFYYQNRLHSCYSLDEKIREEVKAFIKEKASRTDDESLMFLQGLFDK